jgi:ferredoxin
MTDPAATGRASIGAPVLLPREQLDGLVADLIAAGVEVGGPTAAGEPQSPAALAAAADAALAGRGGALDYRVVTAGADLALRPGMPRLSLKGLYLPQNEALFSWRQRGAQIEITSAPTAPGPRVVLGAKPCDAAALAIVDQVMNWGYEDALWNGRREATTVFTLACGVEDESCFCTAVGAAPDCTRGADGLLTPVDGGWIVEAASDKGAAVVAAHQSRFGDVSSAQLDEAAAFRRAARQTVAAHLEIDADSVRDWIATHFDDPLLAALGVRCNGCGACASVCPTCHCFDIVEETDGVGHGTRRRCWDTCQTGKFTLHASGHNPRADQNARFRQRLNHKFSIYPLRFGEVLCTGCGRCTRSCHAGQDLVEILSAIDIAARRPEPVAVASAAGGAATAALGGTPDEADEG